MTLAEAGDHPPLRVVLADANVLYSRVLRDYLLYAATQGVLEIRWSAEILAEVAEHLTENIAGFDAAAGARLVTAMNSAFPAAEVGPDDGAARTVAELTLPDEDDRHVLAAAVAVDADVLCTDNLKDFPTDSMEEVGVQLMSSDALISLLVTEFAEGMLAAHRLAVSRFPGATNDSTLAALRRAGAANAAGLIAGLLGI
ncbi:PIN domain-containing protein [Raineyella sp. W15-4]|uniref:PIN domain-containing protein n=1 Tax=Raineyella sp. W15-4 TaxID=3081651 RepID=UPI002954FDB9|nr:PIN domain-containing protein [Raineyella sp. W15-4]WOQ16944.1 PIN domain-containing protein [Raineyella sp. W15-4]